MTSLNNYFNRLRECCGKARNKCMKSDYPAIN
jgi:hypothetical protein